MRQAPILTVEYSGPHVILGFNPLGRNCPHPEPARGLCNVVYSVPPIKQVQILSV